MFSKKRVMWIAGVMALAFAMAGVRQSVRLEASLLIDAPVEKVWAVLTDFDSYEEWNPYITAASLADGGELAKGAKLKIQMRPAGRAVNSNEPSKSAKDSDTHEPEIFFIRPGVELRWASSLWLPFLFDSEHWYQLEAVGQRTLVRNGEEIKGLFLFLVNRQGTRQGFAAMNEALKIRVEKR